MKIYEIRQNNSTGNLIKTKTIYLQHSIVCLFVWVLWHISLCRLFNAKSIFIEINSSISNDSF